MVIKGFKIVYVLTHRYVDEEGFEDEKLIGIFSSKEIAEKNLIKYKILPGFRNYPAGFSIEEYTVDQVMAENVC